MSWFDIRTVIVQPLIVYHMNIGFKLVSHILIHYVETGATLIWKEWFCGVNLVFNHIYSLKCCIVSRYKSLCPKTWPNWDRDPKQGLGEILKVSQRNSYLVYRQRKLVCHRIIRKVNENAIQGRKLPQYVLGSFSRAVNGARRGALAKSISNWHLIGYNEGYSSNTGYILLPCFYGIRFWIWPEPLVAPRVRRALGTRMVLGYAAASGRHAGSFLYVQSMITSWILHMLKRTSCNKPAVDL
jgi:hypothetical protein